MHFVFGSSMGKTKNFKGRSSNVERYLNSCGREIDISGLIAPNLAAGARLAAKNESSSLDEKTARTYELRLIALETFAAQNGDDAVLFGPNKRPFLAATLQTFMQVMGENHRKKIGTLRCRGLKPPVIRGHAAAFNYWFGAFGHTEQYSETVITADDGSRRVIPKGNPMSSPAVQQTIKQLCKRALRPTTKDLHRGRVPYEPKKALPFSLVQLLRMRQYCLKTVEGMRGLWMWTITLFSFALFLRGEEPLRLKLRHLKLPSNYSVNCGNLPQRIEVKIPWSKADRKAKGVTLSLWANPLNRELCPVSALFVWLLITGMKKGNNYIFPRVAKNNRAVQPNSSRGVTSYRKQFTEMSKTLFETEFSTHSIRRSAARWAARCGANDTSIKRAGRWKSNSFELYTQDARAEMIKEHHDGHPPKDHKMWMFKPLR